MVAETRIAKVTTRFLSIPLDKPLRTAAFPIPAIDTALVEVHTAGGASGVAWSFAFGRGKVASLIRLIDDLSTLVVGQDALMVSHLWEKLVKSSGFIGPRGLAAAAISTLDTACWDIAGIVAGLPIYKMLGGYRESVETYASQGLWLDRSRDELAAEARSLIEAGFTAVKMRAGLADENEDIERVKAVREAIGPDHGLMVDANQAWDLKQTLRMARRLEAFDLLWLEEPMPFERLDDYGAAKVAMAMPLCTGESNYYKDEAVQLVTRRATDLVMLDLMRMGGVTEWMKAVKACEALGATVTPHLFMEHSAHLAAASPNVIWQEYQPWWQPIMAQPIELADGKIKLSDRPGFGIALNYDAVSAFEVS
jgi:L-alanine-DL-glutamate epimerase-like enolase superfamily enzyme